MIRKSPGIGWCHCSHWICPCGRSSRASCCRVMFRRRRSSPGRVPDIGAQVGYAWGSGSGNFTGLNPFTGLPFTTNAGGGNPNGVIGGGNVGYNYEIPGWNWFSSSGAVIGLEGSVDGSSLSKTAVATVPIFGGFQYRGICIRSSMSRVRSEAGSDLAWDRVLIYATGGVAFGGINTDITVFGTDFLELRVRLGKPLDHACRLDGRWRPRICLDQPGRCGPSTALRTLAGSTKPEFSRIPIRSY